MKWLSACFFCNNWERSCQMAQYVKQHPDFTGVLFKSWLKEMTELSVIYHQIEFQLSCCVSEMQNMIALWVMISNPMGPLKEFLFSSQLLFYFFIFFFFWFNLPDCWNEYMTLKYADKNTSDFALNLLNSDTVLKVSPLSGASERLRLSLFRRGGNNSVAVPDTDDIR